MLLCFVIIYLAKFEQIKARDESKLIENENTYDKAKTSGIAVALSGVIVIINVFLIFAME